MTPNDEGIRAIDQDEHNADAHAKRVVLRYQDLNDGTWYNFNPTSPNNEGYDDLALGYTGELLTSLTFKLDGNTVATKTLTYDGDGKLTDIAKT